MIEGVILATGLAPIPREFLQGMTVPLKLTFWISSVTNLALRLTFMWIARLNRDRNTCGSKTASMVQLEFLK